MMCNKTPDAHHMPPYAPPPGARKVFEGKIWSVYQWRQKLFDGSFNTFECLKRPNTAVIIPVVGRKILIQKQIQPHWAKELLSLPAGRCNDGESAADAAARELLEETGYASDDWELLQAVHPHNLIVWERSLFIARNCRKIAKQKLDPGERISLRLVTFQQFMRLATSPVWRDSLISHLIFQCRLSKAARRSFEKKLFGA